MIGPRLIPHALFSIAALSGSIAIAQTKASDRSLEGDWIIADTTDNNTGQREVYAIQMYFGPNGGDFVTLKMRCSTGRPTFFVEWADVAFPDQVVLTIAPVGSAGPMPADPQYIFENSTDPVEHGLRASPETSARIIAAMGQAKSVSVSAHLASGSRTVGIQVDGTQRAWSRVVRHCPIQIVPRPPL